MAGVKAGHNKTEKMNNYFEKLTTGKEEFLRSVSNYAASGIHIEITDFEDNVATVVIKQSSLKNGYILNQKQLVERCKKAFEPTGIKTKVLPVVFTFQADSIDEAWILDKMEEFGIKRNDLIKQLAFDKTYLSRLFASPKSNGKINLTRNLKATFFYYFLTYELNRDFREELEKN